MKFYCEKTILLDAFLAASKASASSQLLHTVDSILIQAEDTLKILGNNLEIAVENIISATIEVTGTIAVNAKKICEIIRRMPDGLITFEANEHLDINIKCKDSNFDILGLSGYDYPEIPEFEGLISFATTTDTIASLVKHTGFAVSANESKPILTGVKFEIGDTSIKAAAVDGYRLALKTELIPKSGVDTACVVPGRSLFELIKIFKDPEDMQVSISGKHILFTFGTCKFLCRLLEGEFLNYSNFLPEPSGLVASVSTLDFIAAIERTALIADDNDLGKTPIRISFKSDKMFLSCATQKGRVADVVDITSNFEQPIEIGFNHRFLLDALRAAGTEFIQLFISESTKPALIMPPKDSDEDFLYLVLPVRLVD